MGGAEHGDGDSLVAWLRVTGEDPRAPRLKGQARHRGDGGDEVRRLERELEGHASAGGQPGRIDARAIDLQLCLELLDDAADIGDIDPFAGVLREAALKKATLGHRRLLARRWAAFGSPFPYTTMNPSRSARRSKLVCV